MAEPLTLNLGQREEGISRRKAYDAACKRDGARSLNEWCKGVLDRAAGFTWDGQKQK